MSDAQITWTANATQMLAEYKRMEDARRKEDQQLQAIKRQNDEVAKSERASNREAAQIKERHMPALERYTKEKERLNGLVARNKITQQEANTELERQRRILEKTDDTAGALGSTLASSAAKAIAGATSVGAGIKALHEIVSAVVRELEDVKGIQERARQAGMSFGESMRSLAFDFKPDESMSAADLEPAVKRLMERTGATDRIAAQTLSAALAGRGSMSNAQAVDIAEQTLRMLPGDAESSSQMAMRAGMLMDKSGIQDPRAALGLMLDIKNVAAVAKLRDVGQSALPAVTSALRFGETPETGAELFTTINNLMGDAEGNRTATAMEALMIQLRDFAPTKKDAMKAKLPKGQLERFNAATTPTERIRALQGMPELSAMFLGDASFEKRAQTSIESLLGGTPEAMAAMQTAQDLLGEPSVAAYEKGVADANALASQALPSADRRTEANIAKSKLASTRAQAFAQARKVVSQTLEDMDFAGPNDTVRSAADYAFSAAEIAGQDPATAARTAFSAAAVQEKTGFGGIMSAIGGATLERPENVLLMNAQLRELQSLNATLQGPPENALGRQ